MSSTLLSPPPAQHPPIFTVLDMATGNHGPSARPSTSPAIPLADVVTANENWRGKNDPAERRRIQNRLNQRAYRQRQRAGEVPKQYKRRVSSDASTSQVNDSTSDSDGDDNDDNSSEGSADLNSNRPSASSSTSTSPPTTARPAGIINPQTGQVRDELAQLINRNFLAAAVDNAQHLGINIAALQSGAAMRTPRPSNPGKIPHSLRPAEPQHQFVHDPIIDTIPHATLRVNILRAIAQNQIDAAAFSRCLRASGALEQADDGSWQRVGVVVWNSAPEQLASWELSERFVRRWGHLLRGCEDLVVATNAWRGRRGERLFPTASFRA